MKVLLLNGSPRKNGCTYTALNVVADALKAEGIDAEVFQAGDPDMENVKAAAAKLKDSDALVVGLLFTGHLQAARSSNLWTVWHL